MTEIVTNGDYDPEILISEIKLRGDVREAASRMTRREARFVADAFDSRQIARIRTGHQERTTRAADEPAEFLAWMFGRDEAMEHVLGAALGLFCRSDPLGRWMLDQKGVGPLLAGRLIALGNWDAPNVAKVWAFAGLSPAPQHEWTKGTKRPWNARLKRLCYLLGESFVKSSNREGAYYGQVYREAKADYWQKNIAGAYVGIAERERVKVDKTTEKWAWNSGCYDADVTARWVTAGMPRKPTLKKAEGGAERVEEILAWIDLGRPEELRPEGDLPDLQPYFAWHAAPLVRGEPGSGLAMLAPGHIHDRARRKAVKLFLAHAWEVEFRTRHPGVEPPRAWSVDLGSHSHHIPPPGFEARA